MRVRRTGRDWRESIRAACKPPNPAPTITTLGTLRSGIAEPQPYRFRIGAMEPETFLDKVLRPLPSFPGWTAGGGAVPTRVLRCTFQCGSDNMPALDARGSLQL